MTNLLPPNDDRQLEKRRFKHDAILKSVPKQISEIYDVTEEAIATYFAQSNPNLRWCQAWSQWFCWDGTVWRRDETLSVFDKVRQYCRNQSVFADSNAESRSYGRASFIAAVEKLCKSDRRYAATSEQFDQDDWLLNTPSGVVDLKTGIISDHDPELYCTRITAVAPDGECNRWRQFLVEITAGNIELIEFLQRIAGYCLTGSTTEHALFFAYGTGGNGKSVFMNALTGILNDYATVSQMETFTESRNDRHPTELAMLQGARLVIAQETEQGKRWAQSRIKALTGGDPVSARYMKRDFFTFMPKFKLLIAGNSKPKLDTVDEAMRRRFHIIPLTQQILPGDRDPLLAEKLKSEWPGILTWAIEGALQYQKIGLAPPPIVTEATENYLESQDVFSEWLKTQCEIGKDHSETPTRLFNSWKVFAEAARERVGRQAEFIERLEASGFHRRRNAKSRRWVGIRILSNTEPPLENP